MKKHFLVLMAVIANMCIIGSPSSHKDTPTLIVNPHSINFGSVLIGDTSEARYVTVQGIDLVGPITYSLHFDYPFLSSYFYVVPVDWNSTTGGALAVYFTPPIGSFPAYIFPGIVSLNIYSPQAETQFVGIGGFVDTPTITANFSVSPNFGPVFVGHSKESIITLTVPNLLDRIYIDVEGTGASAFSIDSSMFNFYNGEGSLKLIFTPQEPVLYEATIHIYTFGCFECYPLAISGTGVDKYPVLFVNPMSLDFGNVEVGNYSVLQPITISSEDLIGSISYEMSAAGKNIYFITFMPWQPAIGGTLGITFKPKYAAYAPATIIFSSQLAEDKVVFLEGTGFILGVDNFAEKTVNFYPNPATTEIVIKSEQAINKIEIYNIVGKLVYTENTIGVVLHKIDISSLKQGMYIVKTYLGNDKIETDKFLKN